MVDRANCLCFTEVSKDTTMHSAVRKFLAQIGAKGGKTTGKSKRRGGTEYYRRIAIKSWENRKRNEQKGRATK